MLFIGIAVFIWASNAQKQSTPLPEVSSISVEETLALIAKTGVLILDVREKSAYDKDHLPNAISVPIGDLNQRLQEFEAHKQMDVVVYCNDGSRRGPTATAQLNAAGFSQAKNLAGGIEAWRASSKVK